MAGLQIDIPSAVQSTQSLWETTERCKSRDPTLGRLQVELEELISTLSSLEPVIVGASPVLEPLHDVVERCSDMCHEFEQAMKAFPKRAKTGLIDWKKMKFMEGDVNEFIDIIYGYRLTLSVGMGSVTRQSSRVSRQFFRKYDEMTQDTAYTLEMQLQRIEEKMALFANEGTASNAADMMIYLNDEREVTKKCLRICEEAKAHLASLSDRELSLLHQQEASQDGVNEVENETEFDDETESIFDTQRLNRQRLDENRDAFADIIGRLQQRLENLVLHGNSGDERERLRLLEDINLSKQCLEVCKAAREVSIHKVYRIGEVVAESDSDQMVVTTEAELFDVKRARAKGNSTQLVGSMTGETLQILSEHRRRTRFAAERPIDSVRAQSEVVAGSASPVFEIRENKAPPVSRPGTGRQSTESGSRRHSKPGPNEIRKRQGVSG